jgi:hypothetical protein
MMIEGSGSRAGSGSIPVTRIRIRGAKKHVDPVDPDSDPEHWIFERKKRWKVFIHLYHDMSQSTVNKKLFLPSVDLNDKHF